MALDAVPWQLLLEELRCSVLGHKAFEFGNVLPEFTSFPFAHENLPENTSFKNYY